VNGKEMAVNAMSSLSCGQVINVHVKDMTNGSYTFSINRDGLFKEFDVMLHDKYTGSIVNLSTASTYSFSVTTTAATKANNRFEIHLDHVPVDLDVAFNSNTTELCQGEDYTLRIVKPQTYVSYSAMIDGNEVSSPIDVVSEVNFIDLVVPSSALVNGQNIISVKAENYCSSEVLNQTIQLTQHGTPTTKASAITLCKGLTGELSADGAPSGGGYNWYSNSNSQTPLFSGFTFVTPVLYETTTYYVGAFNALGCEGDRVPLEVYVPPLEDASITQISKNKLESNYFSGNQWFYNGDLIEGATNQTLTVVRSGTYTVEILVGECTTTDRFEFSRNRKDIESLVSFYPNPVNNSSNLFVEVFATQLNSVSLLNTMGRKVMDINLEYFGADNWAGYLNMESIHAGIYFLKVDADGKTESHRIIVSQQ
jgi:hypothetical protein